MSSSDSASSCGKNNSLLTSDLVCRLLDGDALQALRCRICLELFQVPIVLPCGHTFCLQCLTELCKVAIQNSSSCPVQDLRIGCPQCRIAIYASPILDRNVTCNFVIQALTESLRSRALQNSGRQEHKSVNTDESRVNSTIRHISDIELDKVIDEVDRLSEAIGKRSALDLAYFEVDDIRRQHIHTEEVKQNGGKGLGFTRKPARLSADAPKTKQTHTDITQQQRQWQNLLQQQKTFQEQQLRQREQVIHEDKIHHKQHQPCDKHHQGFHQRSQSIWPPVRPASSASIFPGEGISPFVSTSSKTTPQLSQQHDSLTPAHSLLNLKKRTNVFAMQPVIQRPPLQYLEQRQIQHNRHEQQTFSQNTFMKQQTFSQSMVMKRPPLKYPTKLQPTTQNQQPTMLQHQQNAFTDNAKNNQQKMQEQQQPNLHNYQHPQQQRHQKTTTNGQPFNAVMSQQQAHSHAQTNAPRFATANPDQRLGVVPASENGTGTTSTAHIPLSILHRNSQGLDNDPAVMSYSYRVASGSGTHSTGV